MLARRVDPSHARVRGSRCIWLVEVAVNCRITRNSYGGRAIRKVVDVLGADDVDES